MIRQHFQKGFSMLVYDFNYDDLSGIAYNTLKKNLDANKVALAFYVINFDDLTRSHFSGSDDETIRIWKIKSGQCLKMFGPYVGKVHSLLFQENKIISTAEYERIRIWKIESGRCLQTFPGDKALIRDNNLIITDLSGLLTIYDLVFPSPGLI